MNTIDVVKSTASGKIEDAGVEYAVIKWSILDTLYHSPDVRKIIYTGNKRVGDYKYASFNVIPKRYLSSQSSCNDCCIKGEIIMDTFTYQSKYATYPDCFFRKGKYENGNLAIEVWSNTEGPITKITVNPDVVVPFPFIAIKDYSENEGTVDTLIAMGMIEKEPFKVFKSGWVEIPVHSLTDHGLEMLGIN